MKYVNIVGFPDQQLLNQILNLHETIFKDSDMFMRKAKDRPRLLFTIGFEEGKVVGYKIGYELNSDIFYSWLGGVDEQRRSQGIASKLMEEQHLFIKDKGYKIVQTKTKNKWRNMLILNIKYGFDIVGIDAAKPSDPKIILEKAL